MMSEKLRRRFELLREICWTEVREDASWHIDKPAFVQEFPDPDRGGKLANPLTEVVSILLDEIERELSKPSIPVTVTRGSAE